MSSVPQHNHWHDHARQWNKLGSPLRPSAEDVNNFRNALGAEGGHCLMLGVTPELACLSSKLTAIDNCAAMIGALWTSEMAGKSAIQGDWLGLPFAADAFENIIGDGCLTLLSYPIQYESLFEQLSLVLQPAGKIILRLFVSPERNESCEFVRREALCGKIRSFHAFKWRLSMAIAAQTADHNLAVADIFSTFNSLFPDQKLLASETGWPIGDISTINVYRGSQAIYSFPTLAQVRRTIPPTLKEAGLIHGSYELAERCPIIILESHK